MGEHSFSKSWGLRASSSFFPLPLPCHSVFFALFPAFWTNLARKRLLRRLHCKELRTAMYKRYINSIIIIIIITCIFEEFGFFFPRCLCQWLKNHLSHARNLSEYLPESNINMERIISCPWEEEKLGLRYTVYGRVKILLLGHHITETNNYSSTPTICCKVSRA